MPAFWRAHWSRGGRAFETQDLPEVGSGPLVVCSLLSSAFLLCSRCVACKYGSISHFKGVFGGFPLLDVGLYCLRALRGLCGFCVREWLGGFMACGVFASVFLVFPLLCLPFHLFTCFLSFTLSALFWLSFACPLVFPFLLCFVVSFSLSDYMQKERAQRFCPCVLSLSRCWLC